MNDRDLLRYERELGRRVSGFRRRKRIKEAFRQSLRPLLEEDPAPTYAALEQAFGSPAKLAEELQETTPDLPAPLSRRKKAGIAAGICALAVVVGLGLFLWWDRPEREGLLSDGAIYTEEKIGAEYIYRLDESFHQHDFSWTQKVGRDDYLLIADNTNQVTTTVTVQYSDRQPAHRFVVPAGERRAFLVTDARPRKHTISFMTPDGSMEGRIRLFYLK